MVAATMDSRRSSSSIGPCDIPSDSLGEWAESDDQDDDDDDDDSASVASVSNVVNMLRALARPLPGVLSPASPKELHFCVDFGGPRARKINIRDTKGVLQFQGQLVADEVSGCHLLLVDLHGEEVFSLWPCQRGSGEFYEWRKPSGEAIATIERRSIHKQFAEVIIRGTPKSAIPFDVHCGYSGGGRHRIISVDQRLLGSVARKRTFVPLFGTQLLVQANAGVDSHAVLLMSLLTVLSIHGSTKYHPRPSKQSA
eukprot:GGOE01007716.1.p1 GENE.GGOE01007716.1~~GGOE01007716.1.p1  ORF type:complete len:263 (+),score=82.06 GGOE01007716.1:29-790(+)